MSSNGQPCCSANGLENGDPTHAQLVVGFIKAWGSFWSTTTYFRSLDFQWHILHTFRYFQILSDIFGYFQILSSPTASIGNGNSCLFNACLPLQIGTSDVLLPASSPTPSLFRPSWRSSLRVFLPTFRRFGEVTWSHLLLARILTFLTYGRSTLMLWCRSWRPDILSGVCISWFWCWSVGVFAANSFDSVLLLSTRYSKEFHVVSFLSFLSFLVSLFVFLLALDVSVF